MNEFSWKVAQSPEEAAALKQQSGSQFLAGGHHTTRSDEVWGLHAAAAHRHHWIDRA
ncbi:hypothetical protein [Pantoea sp. 1B4]|uniref:hypothetical protein n=1 Tax=Pantoea sp. 1B4 TaxID=2804760 RepID=UPI002D7E2816|nr:hypothetical protein [Pantoea sp. 1B4]